MKKQLQEAISAGRLAHSTIKEAQRKLDSAEGWGLFDLFGGGMIATMVKRSRMGEARELIEDLRRDLTAFQRELRDVEIISTLDFDDDGLLAFTDLFFDDFFSDLLVQRKINKAQEQLKTIERQVASIVNALVDKYESL